MHRAFVIDVLECSHCGGRLRLIATLHDPAVIRKILAHLRMARSGASPGPARVSRRRALILSSRGAAAAVVPPSRGVVPTDPRAVHCHLTAAVCALSIPLTAGRAIGTFFVIGLGLLARLRTKPTAERREHAACSRGPRHITGPSTPFHCVSTGGTSRHA